MTEKEVFDKLINSLGNYQLNPKTGYATSIRLNESLCPEDDETPMLLGTVGEGADHEHFELYIDDIKELRDYLNNYLSKWDN